MIRLPSRATGCALALLALITPGISQAAPYAVTWSQLFDDTATTSQFPHAMALNSHGDVYVTGHAIVGNAKGFYTAKYDGLDGHLIWSKPLNGSGVNEFIANDIAVDSQGDCVVTGSRNVNNGSGSDIDYYTVKYSGVNGNVLWQKPFDGGSNGGQDIGLKVVCDHANNVIVTGRSEGSTTGSDWVTIKYKASDGTQLYVDSYSQTANNLDDIPAALAVDSLNNVIVGGMVRTASGQLRFHVRKLKAADLTTFWNITPINTGDEGGVTALAVDSNDDVIATGMYKDSNFNFGYYTTKLSASNGSPVWKTGVNSPVSLSSNGSPRPAPKGLALDPDDNPIVTGTLRDASGNYVMTTIKYTAGGFGQSAYELWTNHAVDTGFGFGDSNARAVASDGVGNAIVVGETDSEDGNTDLYIAKYDSLTGAKLFSTGFTGDYGSSPDIGTSVAVDGTGNIVALGELVADKGTGIGLHEFATIKLNRLIAPTGDDLPDGFPGVADNAKVTLAGLPSIGANGTLAARVAFKAGTKTGNTILVEGPGGAILPAVQGQPAPVPMGSPAVNWASFSDPIVAPNGSYAFAAKVTGSAASGVWANLNGTLKPVLRQGSIPPVAGLTDKLASVMNLGISNNNLIALVKLTGPSTTNLAIIRVDQNGVGTVLLRTGKADLMINGVAHTVKGITTFSPALLEAGDGRWQGSSGIVALVSAVQTNNVKVKANAVVSITNAGTPHAYFFTAQTAATPIAGATYSALGLPSTAYGDARFTLKATLTPRPATANTALIFSSTGAAFNAYAQKGAITGVTGLPAAVTYADFSDPQINTNSRVAFIATLKGSATDVKSTSNKAIVFGDPVATLVSIARLGDFAPDGGGNPTAYKWTGFTALALPGGTNSGPIFVAKLSAPKANLGLFARDSAGKVRRLLCVGDVMGDQTVKKFTLLTAVSTAMSAARSFDSAGSVAAQVTFTDGKTALIRIGIP